VSELGFHPTEPLTLALSPDPGERERVKGEYAGRPFLRRYLNSTTLGFIAPDA
jgi:hypothetical protein